MQIDTHDNHVTIIQQMSLYGFVARTCSSDGVVEWIAQRHYSQTCPKTTRHAFELISPDGNRVGLCLFGLPSRLQTRKSFPGFIELTRLWVDDSVPKNGESFLISYGLRWLKKNTNYSGVLSYADPNVGHIGTIYKACNFKFDGQSGKSYHYKNKEGKRVHIRSVWGRYKKRQLNDSDWTEAKQAEAEELIRVNDNPKNRFIYNFNKKTKVEAIKPPPKRSERKITKSTEQDILGFIVKSGCQPLSRYGGSTTPISIRCKCGQIFDRIPKLIQRSNVLFCKKCRYENQATQQTKRRDYSKMIEKMGGEIIGILPQKTSDRVQIKCGKHGILFDARVSNLVHGHWNCPKCSGKYLITKEECSEFVSKRGGVFISNEVKSAIEPLLVRCSSNHEFEISWNRLKSGRWCGRCSKSRFIGEEIARQFMEFVFNHKFKKSKPKWLTNNANRLELDGYCEELKVAFEYDGDQHFRHVTKFSKTNLEDIQKTDDIKNKLCKESGVILFRFKEPWKDIPVQFKEQNKIFGIGAKNDPDKFDPDVKFAYLGKAERQISRLIEALAKKNWEYLSGDYLGVNSLMNIKCPNGHAITRHFTSVVHKGIFYCRECVKPVLSLNNE